MRGDRLDTAALRRALGPWWQRVDVVARTGSTNADLLGDPAAPDPCVLVAEEQTAGRGRLDRTWTAPPGTGLTFSILVRPAVPVARRTWLPLLTGQALHDALPVPTGVKWPNDVLAPGTADGRKLAGILVQSTGTAVVVGIGLNVAMSQEELPVATATSLQLEGATTLDRSTILCRMLEAFTTRYTAWTAADGDAQACGLAAAYRDSCVTLGTDVRVDVGPEPLVGRASGIDTAGRLVVSTPGGPVPVSAGDVRHVRPAR